MMDVQSFLNYLEGHLPTPPVWNPEADQDKEFNKWKRWSSERALIDRVRNRYDQEAKREAEAAKGKLK